MLGFGALGQLTLGQGGSTVPAAQDITGALYTNAAAFYGATVTPGSVTVGGSLFANGETFYAATLTPGAVNIAGSLFSDADTFYAATVVAEGGPQTITAARFDNASAFYSATVSADQTITGALLVNSTAFYASTLVSGQRIGGALYANDNQFFGATLSGGQTTATPVFVYGPGKFYHPELARQDAERARRKAQKKVLRALGRKGMLADEPERVATFVAEASLDAFAALDQAITAAQAASATEQLMRLAFAFAQQLVEDEDDALLLMAA